MTLKTIADMQYWSGVNSRDHGFHDDWPMHPPVDLEPNEEAEFQRQLQLAITEKLDLIHSEISEALEEIRKGHDPLHVYYTSTVKDWDSSGVTAQRTEFFSEQHYWDNGGVEQPKYKPEGFLVELADAVIRIGDLVFLLGGDLQAAIAEKHEYNRTRPYKHGKKF